jgi:hypothetical protein
MRFVVSSYGHSCHFSRSISGSTRGSSYTAEYGKKYSMRPSRRHGLIHINRAEANGFLCMLFLIPLSRRYPGLIHINRRKVNGFFLYLRPDAIPGWSISTGEKWTDFIISVYIRLAITDPRFVHTIAWSGKPYLIINNLIYLTGIVTSPCSHWFPRV